MLLSSLWIACPLTLLSDITFFFFAPKHSLVLLNPFSPFAASLWCFRSCFLKRSWKKHGLKKITSCLVAKSKKWRKQFILGISLEDNRMCHRKATLVFIKYAPGWGKGTVRQLTDWPTHRPTDWPTTWLTDWLAPWRTDRWTAWLIKWLTAIYFCILVFFCLFVLLDPRPVCFSLLTYFFPLSFLLFISFTYHCFVCLSYILCVLP